jgi:hypothetical protein
MPIEVEVRSWISPSMQEKIRKKLARMRLLRSGKSLDLYYDTADFALLRHPQMVFFRLRERRLLQVKFDETTAPDQTPTCIEREFSLDMNCSRHFCPTGNPRRVGRNSWSAMHWRNWYGSTNTDAFTQMVLSSSAWIM